MSEQKIQHAVLVDYYTVTPSRFTVGTAGSYGIETLAFSFSSLWDGLSKTVTFYPPRRSPVSVILLDQKEIEIPPEALLSSGNVSCVVSGNRDGKRIYSVEFSLCVIPTKTQIGAQGKKPTPSEIEQIRNYAEQVLEAVDEVKKTAENIENVFNGAVLFDEKQTLSEDEKEQARSNIGAKKDFESLNPDEVVFKNGFTATFPVGKKELVNGKVEVVAPGGTLADFLDAFVEEKKPSVILPSASVVLAQAGSHEVGTAVTPSFAVSFDQGSYEYGPANTGVSVFTRVVESSTGESMIAESGSFSPLTVSDAMASAGYFLTATVYHSDGSVPYTNLGNEDASSRIAAGNVTATSEKITGYRNSFYGTLTSKTAPSSDVVRGLTKSGKALANGSSFTITIPVGALRVMFAYPATLRDCTSVKDVNGLNAEILSGFTASTVSVKGANGYDAISYKVYVLDFASANDKANTFKVTI